MFNAQYKLAGRYKLTVRKESGVIVRETPWTDNIITNAGLDQIGDVQNYNWSYDKPDLAACCKVGSGSAAEQETDTALQSQIASTRTWLSDPGDIFVDESVVPEDEHPAYFSKTRIYRFSTGAAAGNISEVGTSNVMQDPNDEKLFSRALVRDAGGTPTTITVLADEILDVTYELRCYIDKTVSPFTMTINGVTLTGVTSICGLGSAYSPQIMSGYRNSGDFVGVYFMAKQNEPPDRTVYSGYGFGASVGQSGRTIVATPYNSGNYYRLWTVTVGLTAGNFGIRTLTIAGNHGNRRWVFDAPGIVKNNTQKMDIAFKITWDRYTP